MNGRPFPLAPSPSRFHSILACCLRLEVKCNRKTQADKGMANLPLHIALIHFAFIDLRSGNSVLVVDNTGSSHLGHSSSSLSSTLVRDVSKGTR